MEYGMTPQGFKPKRFAEILGEMNEELAEIIDPTSGERPFLNSTDDTILQQIAAVFAEQLAFCWNAAAEGAIQFDPLKNTGAGQSGTVQLNGILRKTGTATVIGLLCTGVSGTVIPAGSIVTDAGKKVMYATVAEAVIYGNSAVVNAAAMEKGTPAPGQNTVVFMARPISGWQSVTNVSLVHEGTVEETDEELRRRQQWSTALPAMSIVEAVYAALANVSGVQWARVYQNINLQSDSRGIPGKEVAPVVVGGSDEEIADVLWRRLPLGMQGFGTTAIVKTDAQGFEYQISFTRPVKIPIFVSVTVTVSTPGLIPQNAAELIKQRIIDYARYGGEGNDAGFPPGTGVIRSRLFTPVNGIPGHGITDLKIGTEAESLAEQDISIAWNQVSEWIADNITVTVNQP